MKRVILSASLLVAGATLLASAHAAVPAKASLEAKTDRLTDLMVELVPLGRIFEVMAKGDPKWPMQGKPDAVTPAQLSCLRAELSMEGYRRAKRKAVAEYVSVNHSRIDDEVKLLEGGAPALMSRLFMAEIEGKQITESEVLAAATAEELASFESLMTMPDYAELLKLSGLGSTISADKPIEQNKQDGVAAGKNLVMQEMLRAMDACEVSMATLFN